MRSVTRLITSAVSLAGFTALGCQRATTEPLPPGSHVGYYVTTAGSPAGTGATDSPWDLATALDGGPGGNSILPGDTVWIRDGHYVGTFGTTLDGSTGNYITFRAYPGERATIDGQLRASSGASFVTFWGLEVMQSNPKHASLGGYPTVLIEGADVRLINLIVHDAGTQGISSYNPAPNNFIYGSIIYNNGNEENLDHGIYIHESNKRIEDCILFNNMANGLHGYETNPQANLYLKRNVSFNNGSISIQANPNPNNLLIRGVGGSVGAQVLDNMLYHSRMDDGDNMRIGDNANAANNHDVVVRGNYIAGGKVGLLIEQWESVTAQDNVVLGSGSDFMVRLKGAGSISTAWSGNTWHRDSTASAWGFSGTTYTYHNWKTASGLGGSDQIVALPTTPKVFVLPNAFEPGRATIVVYNWPHQASVDVSLAGVLQSRDQYVLRNVQNFFGTPVATGTYSGTLPVSMAGVNPPALIGRTLGTPTKTGPEFDVFVVQRVTP